MSEQWLMELLQAVRDVAGKSGYARLAEHLDDAILVAASEVHDRLGGTDTGLGELDGRFGAEDLRGAARPAIH